MDRKLFDKFILHTYTRYPLTLIKGKGMKVWDDEGDEYLDFFPGWGAGNLGHCHPRVVEAVHNQIDKIMHIPNVYYNVPQGELAQLIVNNSFDGQVFFCNSGAEANEGAIKLVRKRNHSKKIIITLVNSFHGRTLATLTATGQTEYQQGFDPLLDGFIYCEVNNCAMLQNLMNEQVAAIMMEPILGEGGIVPLSPEFLQTASSLCDSYNALLILDEVQTGIGRTGKMFAFQHFNIEPDILTLAKSLGGGLAIGAFVVKRDYCDVFQPGNHGSTFGGNPVACSAGVAVLKTISEENLLENARTIGYYFYQKLQFLQHKYTIIKDVRGIGLMLGVELKRPGAEIVDCCRERKLLINCTHKNVLRLMPAINATSEEIDLAVAVLDEVLGGFKE